MKNSFEKLFGSMPPWKQRLIRALGPRNASGESKHARGRHRPRNFWQARKKRNKAAKLMRRRNRSAR